MKLFLLLFFSCIFPLLAQAAEENKRDCRVQVFEKNLLALCKIDGGPFQHYHFSLYLNNDQIFNLVEDYAENISLEHTVPEGPSIEFPLSKQAGLTRVKISGGCTPVSKGDIEIARICNFSWGKHQIIKNIWFDFPDDDPIRKKCLAGQTLVNTNEYSTSLPLLNDCIQGSKKNDFLRRQAFIYRAWANFSLNNYKAAVDDQKAALAISPAQNQLELMNMAVYARSIKQYQEALDFLYQAEIFDKFLKRISMPTQYHLGWTLRLLGKNTDAVKVFTDAIPAQPTFNGVFYQRGLAYEALGNREAAKADFEKVREIMLKDLPTHMKDSFFPEISAKLAEYGITLDSKQN